VRLNFFLLTPSAVVRSQRESGECGGRRARREATGGGIRLARDERAGGDRQDHTDPHDDRRPFAVEHTPHDGHDRADDRGDGRDHADCVPRQGVVEEAEAEHVDHAGAGTENEIVAGDGRGDSDRQDRGHCETARLRDDQHTERGRLPRGPAAEEVA